MKSIQVSEYSTALSAYISRIIHSLPSHENISPLINLTTTKSTDPSKSRMINSSDKVSSSINDSITEISTESKFSLNPSRSIVDQTLPQQTLPNINIISLNNIGEAFTSQGPAEYPESGDILDNPNLLWTEDKWNDERYEEAKLRIKKQGPALSKHWLTTYTTKASNYWDKFYKRNRDRFYKDRHYLHIVFPEILTNASSNSPDDRINLLEVGCGVGNAAIPLLDVNPKLYITAIDFAASAISIFKDHPSIESGRVFPSQCDIIHDVLPVQNESMDLILCMFVISAISPENHRSVFTKLIKALKPGGKLLFRDYGRYDEAQLRFGKGSKLEENLYVRQDGTCAYYFDKDELAGLICECLENEDASRYHMVVEESEYITRQYANRQQKQARYRVWVHAKYSKQLNEK